jgi:hypothetical protein
MPEANEKTQRYEEHLPAEYPFGEFRVIDTKKCHHTYKYEE